MNDTSEFCQKHYLIEEKIENIEENIGVIHSDMNHIKYLLGVVIAVLLGVGVGI